MESELPEELIELILLRLPVKSILNFKRVSPQWRILITSNSFAFRLHHQLQTFANPGCSSFFLLQRLWSYNPNVIMHISLCDRDRAHSVDNVEVPVSDSENMEWKRVLFPLGYGVFGVVETSTLTVLLWNPTTSETKLLSASTYDPIDFLHHYHFGTTDYDKDGNFWYKVGRFTLRLILENGHIYGLSLELYSSKTKSWKFISHFASGDYLRFKDAVFQYATLNGKAHWMIHFEEDTNDTYVTTFDYETEVFGKIKAPSPIEDSAQYDERVCTVTLFDHKFLCLVLSRRESDECWQHYYLDIWVMREYGAADSWTKEFTVGPIPWDMEVAGFSSKVGGVFVHRRYNYTTSPLLMWDCKSSTSKKCCLLSETVFNKCMIVEHVESLASLST